MHIAIRTQIIFPNHILTFEVSINLSAFLKIILLFPEKVDVVNSIGTLIVLSQNTIQQIYLICDI